MADTNFTFIDSARLVSVDAMHNLCDGIGEALNAADHGAELRLESFKRMLRNISGTSPRFRQLKTAIEGGRKAHARRQLTQFRNGLVPRKPVITVQTGELYVRTTA